MFFVVMFPTPVEGEMFPLRLQIRSPTTLEICAMVSEPDPWEFPQSQPRGREGSENSMEICLRPSARLVAIAGIMASRNLIQSLLLLVSKPALFRCGQEPFVLQDMKTCLGYIDGDGPTMVCSGQFPE